MHIVQKYCLEISTLKTKKKVNSDTIRICINNNTTIINHLQSLQIIIEGKERERERERERES